MKTGPRVNTASQWESWTSIVPPIPISGQQSSGWDTFQKAGWSPHL